MSRVFRSVSLCMLVALNACSPAVDGDFGWSDDSASARLDQGAEARLKTVVYDRATFARAGCVLAGTTMMATDSHPAPAGVLTSSGSFFGAYRRVVLTAPATCEGKTVASDDVFAVEEADLDIHPASESPSNSKAVHYSDLLVDTPVYDAITLRSIGCVKAPLHPFVSDPFTPAGRGPGGALRFARFVVAAPSCVAGQPATSGMVAVDASAVVETTMPMPGVVDPSSLLFDLSTLSITRESDSDVDCNNLRLEHIAGNGGDVAFVIDEDGVALTTEDTALSQRQHCRITGQVRVRGGVELLSLRGSIVGGYILANEELVPSTKRISLAATANIGALSLPTLSMVETATATVNQPMLTPWSGEISYPSGTNFCANRTGTLITVDIDFLSEIERSTTANELRGGITALDLTATTQDCP